MGLVGWCIVCPFCPNDASKLSGDLDETKRCVQLQDRLQLARKKSESCPRLCSNCCCFDDCWLLAILACILGRCPVYILARVTTGLVWQTVCDFNYDFELYSCLIDSVIGNSNYTGYFLYLESVAES